MTCGNSFGRHCFILIFVLLSGATASIDVSAQQTREERNEAILWGTIENSTNPEDFRAYLEAYPNGVYAPLAKRRVATLVEAKEWAAVEKSTNPDDLRGYVERFPTGSFTAAARTRLASLLEARAAAEARLVIQGALMKALSGPWFQIREPSLNAATRLVVRNAGGRLTGVLTEDGTFQYGGGAVFRRGRLRPYQYEIHLEMGVTQTAALTATVTHVNWLVDGDRGSRISASVKRIQLAQRELTLDIEYRYHELDVDRDTRSYKFTNIPPAPRAPSVSR